MSPDSAGRTRRLRRAFADRAASTGAPLLASALHAYADAEGRNWADLAREIGGASDTLDRIACCFAPRPDAFLEDARAIAEYAGADPDSLLLLLRQLQVIETFSDEPVAAGSSSDDARPFLLAARDRDEESPGDDDA